MKKIISLFERNYDTDRLVNKNVVKGAEWVIEGKGIATRKWDGTSCAIINGKLYKRYDLKPDKVPPKNGIKCMPQPDINTGHNPYWVPVGDGPEDSVFRLADISGLEDGTYELCGPKINRNPERLVEHKLIRHGDCVISDCPRTFDEIKAWIYDKDIEGIVWHYNGEMVKIKKKDFGFKR